VTNSGDTQFVLIAAEKEDELQFIKMYADAAAVRAQLWGVPEAEHTQALRFIREYAKRLLDFFNEVLSVQY
jgi:hypothetical protein